VFFCRIVCLIPLSDPMAKLLDPEVTYQNCAGQRCSLKTPSELQPRAIVCEIQRHIGLGALFFVGISRF